MAVSNNFLLPLRAEIAGVALHCIIPITVFSKQSDLAVLVLFCSSSVGETLKAIYLHMGWREGWGGGGIAFRYLRELLYVCI